MDNPYKFFEAIQQNKFVVFAGARLSSMFNIPNLRKLVRKLLYKRGETKSVKYLFGDAE